jgi:hypothetical protein
MSEVTTLEATSEALRRAVAFVRATVEDDRTGVAAASLGYESPSDSMRLTVAVAHVAAALVEGVANSTEVSPGTVLDALAEAMLS